MNVFILVLTLIFYLSVESKPSIKSFRNLYKNPSGSVPRSSPDIIGGNEAKPHSIPYQAFLEVFSLSSGWYCGGSLISKNYILTAGHCGDGATYAQVTLGAHNIQLTEITQIFTISTNITVHEDYDATIIVNDIAILQLMLPVEFTDAIQPVSLPTDVSNDFVGAVARASGWGLVDGNAFTLSSVLNYADLEIISNQKCGSWLGLTLEDSIVCTSGENNQAACNGDSGGPLTVNNELVGITSFGLMGCPNGAPSAFTRVTSFVEWIKGNSDVN